MFGECYFKIIINSLNEILWEVPSSIVVSIFYLFSKFFCQHFKGKVMKKLFTSLFVVLLFSIALIAQPVVNGDLSDAQYTTIATKANTNSGFGTAIDVSKIVYYADVNNSVLYFGMVGKLDASSNNAIGVWLNVTGTGSPTGIAAGDSLGVSGGGSYMSGGGANSNFKADFEVDYMFAFNPGSGSSNVYWDASKLVGGSTAEYQGSCDQSGTTATNGSAAGGIFTQNSISFAFNNGGGANQGLEMAIPFSEIGATSAMSIQAFAFVVSGDGYFSNVTVPGDITTGNLAYNPDFSTLSGGLFHSDPVAPLPVELTSFTASTNAKTVVLKWNTATELNNFGFNIERKSENSTWAKIGFVKGSGNSNSPKEYSYVDNTISVGKCSYRLKQIDNNGDYKYSKVVEVNFGFPAEYSLNQNYPNPFNPSTTISYSLPQGANVKLVFYNALGQEMRILANGFEAAGIHTMNFNAQNLTSGIYFYKLEAGSFSQVKKMILLK